MRPRTSGHYIGANEATSIPTRHVILDTEALTAKGSRFEVQQWRLGVAAFARWRDGGWKEVQQRRYDTPADLWAEVDAACRDGKRTVVWAHNLSYDLRIGQALKWLRGLGWELDDIRLSRQGTWARWRKGRSTLQAVDSYSVWPTSLEKIGALFGMSKLDLPEGDDREAWYARCERDVDILTTAVLSYLDWLRDDDLGNWQITGASQAWSTWRHRFLTEKILVADDWKARDAEQAAMWTGRAEAWRHGKDAKATVFEWDISNAYPRICRGVDLPVRQTSVSRGLGIDRLVKYSSRWAILAEVEVSTDAPVVPATMGDYIVWPVGCFSSTLWDPELRLLQEAGARVRVGRVWLYQRKPALQDWAVWILGELEKPDSVVPAWRKVILKHWSRVLIGRFAMRYTEWQPFAETDRDDLALWQNIDLRDDSRYSLMQVGTEIRRSTDEKYGRDAVPAITGYVMSECRARLWRTIRAVGEGHVFYMDTDSLLVDADGDAALSAYAQAHPEIGWRRKGEHKGYDIIGTRKIMLGSQVRVAGVPKGARLVGDWRFRGEVWDGLGESVRRGEADAVRVTERDFRVLRGDRRRRRRDDGSMVPYVLGGES